MTTLATPMGENLAGLKHKRGDTNDYRQTVYEMSLQT